jgi:methyl-accepting chemotaxis protein
MQELSATISQVSSEVRRNAENVNVSSEYIDQAAREVERSNAYMASLLESIKVLTNPRSHLNHHQNHRRHFVPDKYPRAQRRGRGGACGQAAEASPSSLRRCATSPQSADAAKQTSNLINTSIESIKEGMKLAESTASALEAVAEKAQLVEQSNQSIREASNAQAQAIAEIELGLQQFSDSIQTISATSEENAATSEQISSQAQILFEQISRYKTNER